MPRDLQTFPDLAPAPDADDLAAKFLAFCRGKPAGEEYDICDPLLCACGQFKEAAGLSDDARWAFELRHNSTIYARPRTFGDLVSRLENAR